MKRPTRVQVYEGLYRSQADELFQADAAEAARHGWRAVDEGRWNGEQLAVTFVRDGAAWRGAIGRPKAPPTTAPRAPETTPKRSRMRRFASAFTQAMVFLVLIGALIVAILGVALIADVGNLREMSQDLPKPIPRLVKDYLEWVRSVRG